MIKAQELRTGNWVRLKVEGRVDEYAKVIEILEQSVVTTIAGVPQRNPYSNLHGISLTPELLEKAGFSMFEYGPNNECTGYEVYWGMGNWFQGFLNPDNAFSLLKFEQGHQIIQYLHQLQNLYYSLTGQELNIQL